MHYASLTLGYDTSNTFDALVPACLQYILDSEGKNMKNPEEEIAVHKLAVFNVYMSHFLNIQMPEF